MLSFRTLICTTWKGKTRGRCTGSWSGRGQTLVTLQRLVHQSFSLPAPRQGRHAWVEKLIRAVRIQAFR